MNRVVTMLGALGLTMLTCWAGSGFSDPRLSDSKMIRMPTPETVDFMKSADAVYVYPLKKGSGEHRLIDGEQKAALLAIFLDPANYYQGLYCIGEPPPDFGIEFRKKDEKLFLICSGSLIKGNFRGRQLSGSLESWGNGEFTKWCQKYRATVR